MPKVNTKLGWIKVEVKGDNCGNITVRPIVDKYATRLGKVREEFTGWFDTTVFFNDGGEASEFLENDVPKRYHTHLRNGYSVCFLADPWVVGHWYGYDAHTIVESGELFK